MRIINLFTDAPYHNLALMQLSAWHKSQGDIVTLNQPTSICDYRYASILFEKNMKKVEADEFGGPAFKGSILEIKNIKPDYSLYPKIDYSLGYTYRNCFRKCGFCKVPVMTHPDIDHHSIWEFHDPKFKKICLLNNNTFFDKQWRETFEEIWNEDLIIRDENGYDLRLLDDEKANALHHTKFDGYIHFAWDSVRDEFEIRKGIEIAKKHKLLSRGMVYVLIGYDSTEEEDFHRCQVLVDYRVRPYVMPFNQSKKEKKFKRFIDSFMWRKYSTLAEAWKDYDPQKYRKDKWEV